MQAGERLAIRYATDRDYGIATGGEVVWLAMRSAANVVQLSNYIARLGISLIGRGDPTTL